MGLTYMCFWPLFPDHPWARYCCASVPFASGILVVLVGIGAIWEPGLQGAASVRGATSAPGRTPFQCSSPVASRVMAHAVSEL